MEQQIQFLCFSFFYLLQTLPFQFLETENLSDLGKLDSNCYLFIKLNSCWKLYGLWNMSHWQMHIRVVFKASRYKIVFKQPRPSWWLQGGWQAFFTTYVGNNYVSTGFHCDEGDERLLPQMRHMCSGQLTNIDITVTRRARDAAIIF